MNHWLDRIQTSCGGSLDIFDDRLPFGKNPYKMADIATRKPCGRNIL